MRFALAFLFCLVCSPTLALNPKPAPAPCCIACAKCACNRNCLCPGAPEHYRLTHTDFWAVAYVSVPEKPETLSEMIAGSIRWAIPHRKPSVWIGIPVEVKR